MQGRERVLADADTLPAPVTVVLDAIARHRATRAPLKQVLAELSARRRLGKTERQVAADALFAWARRRLDLEARIDEAVAGFGGVPPRRRDQDLCAVLAANPGLCDAKLPAPLDALWRTPLAERLPPFVRAQIAHLPDADALEQALLQPAKVGFAVDPSRLTRGEAILALQAQKPGVRPHPLCDTAIESDERIPLGKLPPAVRAAVWPMNPGSQLIAQLAQPPAGEWVLDLCGGGGGKAKLLGALGHRVVVCDIDRDRLQAARARDIPAAVFVLADGTAPPFAPRSFARVLVDAPCTASGTLRHSPDRALRLDAARVDAYSKVQQQLLAQALRLCREDGVVVYATCSLFAAENEEVVTPFVNRGEATAVPLSSLAAGLPAGPAMTLRPDVHGTDGFFVAALRPH